MHKDKRSVLERAGFKVGDAADFLEMTAEEREVLAFRLELAKTVRERRLEEGLTQSEMANKLGSSQSRVAKMETAAPTVSFDLLLRGLFAAGGGMKDLAAIAKKAEYAGRRGEATKGAAAAGRRPKRARKVSASG
jgi:hypothetical protein